MSDHLHNARQLADSIVEYHAVNPTLPVAPLTHVAHAPLLHLESQSTTPQAE
jgi:hypothetical protein